jgi:signal transduction histidine kinase
MISYFLRYIPYLLNRSCYGGSINCLFFQPQEALHNIVKHSRARRVELRLEGEDNGVRLEIKDWDSGLAIMD